MSENTNSNKDTELTQEVLDEALELIKSLTPQEAPSDMFLIETPTGLKIVKNKYLPSNTVAVSEDLFNKIYSSAKEQTNKEGSE